VEEVEGHSAALKRELEIKHYQHDHKAELAETESLAKAFTSET
jgi:predicted GIY-YIG superfamily endonuclease